MPTRRRNEGIFGDVQSDIIIDVEDASFALHKIPLSSRSGKIRKLVAEHSDSDPSHLALLEVPGGPDGFELAVMFCYGGTLKLTPSNVACMYCVAHYLEMTEDYGERNLLAVTEAYLSEMVLIDWEKTIEVLISCQMILPFAEKTKVVNRCIDAIASLACREQRVPNLPKGSGPLQKATIEWWAEHLTSLNIDVFQRVLYALRSRGLRIESLGGAIMHYAQRTLKSLHGRNSNFTEHEQRILVETIVSLLPPEAGIVPITFLIGLLRTAIILDTTVACRLDLERRIGSQLDEATLDDLLIPSFLHKGDSVFDVDIVHRVLRNFLQQNDVAQSSDSHPVYDSDGFVLPSHRKMMRVGKLVDTYLAEIAADPNLRASKFIALAELLPDYARVVDDGIYRAIDIYLKAHPTLSVPERKKICKLMDCQKLSGEACSHAAQNERLPVQFVVQVLYFEQVRLKNALAGSYAGPQQQTPPSYVSQRISSGPMSAVMSPRDNDHSYSALQRENKELKLEVAQLRLRLSEIQKEYEQLKQEMDTTSSAVRFFTSFTKKLGKMNPFSKSSSKGLKTTNMEHSEGNNVAGRRRRHSIS